MDAAHFGLRQRPFPTTPDSSYYYPATSHEQALGRLLQGLEDGAGVLALTGPPGSGKTLVCHCLLERLGEQRPSLLLTNSHVRDRASLLQALLFDLSLPYEGKCEQEMRLALTAQLLDTFRNAGRTSANSTVLVIDEAHHLSADLLEELRLLGNLEARAGKAVQVILAGQEPLLDTLRQPELKALRQRLTVRVALQPLDVQEAADYLLHHLRAAGGQAEQIFTTEALTLTAQAAQGIPRLLNQIAHQALAVATAACVEQVDAEVVLEALAVLEIELPGTEAASAESTPAVEPTLTLPEQQGADAPRSPTGPGSSVREPFTQEELAGQRFLAPKRPA